MKFTEFWATIFGGIFWGFFLELPKKLFFLSAPPPLSGRTSSGVTFFAASLMHFSADVALSLMTGPVFCQSFIFST